MLAAFSVPIEQNANDVVLSLCLQGFRYAVHVTAVMSMKTHRDAFLMSLAKFASLHDPAQIKQRNINVIKVGILICLLQIIVNRILCNGLFEINFLVS